MNMSFDSMSTNILALFYPVNTPARENSLSFSACEGGIAIIVVENRASMGNWGFLSWYHPRTLVTIPLAFTATRKFQKS